MNHLNSFNFAQKGLSLNGFNIYHHQNKYPKTVLVTQFNSCEHERGVCSGVLRSVSGFDLYTAIVNKNVMAPDISEHFLVRLMIPLFLFYTDLI